MASQRAARLAAQMATYEYPRNRPKLIAATYQL
jgi:hypothetical protein